MYRLPNWRLVVYKQRDVDRNFEDYAPDSTTGVRGECLRVSMSRDWYFDGGEHERVTANLVYIHSIGGSLGRTALRVFFPSLFF